MPYIVSPKRLLRHPSAAARPASASPRALPNFKNHIVFHTPPITLGILREGAPKMLSPFIGRLAPGGSSLGCKEVFPGAKLAPGRAVARCSEGLDLWYALPRHHSARPRPQLTGCFALQEHHPHASRLIASAPFAP